MTTLDHIESASLASCLSTLRVVWLTQRGHEPPEVETAGLRLRHSAAWSALRGQGTGGAVPLAGAHIGHAMNSGEALEPAWLAWVTSAMVREVAAMELPAVPAKRLREVA